MFRLGGAIDLPASAPTSTFAYLGIRGYGKTYAAGVQVEEFLAAGVQVVVVDPVGVWFGLRLAAGGKNPSRFDVPVFGGSHGDLPLEPTAGELIARIAVESRRSLVLDVSDWTLGEQRRFVTAFATQLFQLKKANRSPIHLVFEEAHEFFPQFVEGAAAPLVGATNRLWKIGRNYGIGGTLISQRAAEVNKSALNLTETLITTRLKAPEDVKRIDGWANANGVDDKAIALLPSLPKRQVIVWTDEGAQVTQFNPKETFDASRTPEAGDAAPAPGPLAPLNVEAIREAMAATIEEAKANDPKALREEVARLRAELGAPARLHKGEVALSEARFGEFRDRIHASEAEVTRLRVELAALEGATPAEIRRLRAMENSFNEVIDATAGYQRWNRGQLEAMRGTPVLPVDFPTNPDGHKSFRVTLARQPSAPLKATTSQPPEGWTMEEEALYQKFKERLIKEVPGLLKVLARAPEIEVTVIPEVITIDGKSLRGRIAQLLANGFLDTGKKNGEVVNELGRTGPSANSGNVSSEIHTLIGLGFIHRTEGGRFIIAPGAKVNIKR